MDFRNQITAFYNQVSGIYNQIIDFYNQVLVCRVKGAENSKWHLINFFCISE
jgi:hypothetical protein